MDITTPTTTTTSFKTIDSPSPIKSLSFTNGLLNQLPIILHYGECLKNHAATLGGHALDGCGEFMASPSATASDPTSLKCAACGCHRNFHRRDPDDSLPFPPKHALIEYQPLHRHRPPPPIDGAVTPTSPSPPPISSYPASAPHMLLALTDGYQNHDHSAPIAQIRGHSSGRKRFRTKFSPNQKEKMMEFANRIGWKIQKRDEREISDFCSEIGVERGVLKVWMHNNKSNLGKREISSVNLTNNNGHNPYNFNKINGNGSGENQQQQINQSESSGSPRDVNGTMTNGNVNGNASSSSS